MPRRRGQRQGPAGDSFSTSAGARAGRTAGPWPSLPPMDSPAQTLDQVLALLAPVFTANGYRKSARTFVASGGGVARVVVFQTNQLKKPDEASFTMNVQ